MKKWCLLFILISIAPAVFSCSSEDGEKKGTAVSQITVMTHDSFSVSKPVVSAFEEKSGIKLTFLKSGDAGEALNKAILAKDNPLADVFYGVDNTFLGRALAENIFIPYRSPLLDKIHDHLKLDPENRLLPVDFGDVCINYDRRWFQEGKIDPPGKLADLTRPSYKGLLVVQNPATSSPGLAFLLTTVAKFGEKGYLEFWQKLKSNGLVITNGWEDAYWGKFSAASDGEIPMVVSYASSPAAEVYFSEEQLDTAPTGAMTSGGSAFRQIEFVGILKGTPEQDLAEKTVDFFLSRTFQEDIPLQMFVFPANREAALPTVFEKHARITDNPAGISAETIAENRDKWIREWTETILK